METLIEVRQSLIGIYKKYDIAINYVMKFILGLFIFSRINSLGLHS